MIKKDNEQQQPSDIQTYTELGVTVGGVVSYITAALMASRTPVKRLPAVLNYTTAMRRPGLSESTISANVIQNNGKYKIMTTEKLPDEQDNVVNKFVENIVTQIVKAIREDAAVTVTIPTGAINITAEGANLGGPVVCTGTNILPINLTGIIQ